MALKNYTKKPTKINKNKIYREEIYIQPIVRKKSTSAWEFFGSMYKDLIEYLSLSRMAGVLVPATLIIVGVGIIFNQVWPEIEQKILEREGYFDQGTAPLVAGDYIQERQLYLSNPGVDYFKKLTTDAFNDNAHQEDPDSINYNGKFELSIPSLNLNKLPVTANVDSGTEEGYQSILESSLAHFKGTSLPMSEFANNVVIYGHSANGSYYERTQDPAGAFSRLQNIKIGAEITVSMEGKEYKYKVSKTKIVNPDDISIINGDGKHNLTLFTCFPNGNPAKRFVVIARPIS